MTDLRTLQADYNFTIDEDGFMVFNIDGDWMEEDEALEFLKYQEDEQAEEDAADRWAEHVEEDFDMDFGEDLY